MIYSIICEEAATHKSARALKEAADIFVQAFPANNGFFLVESVSNHHSANGDPFVYFKWHGDSSSVVIFLMEEIDALSLIKNLDDLSEEDTVK